MDIREYFEGDFLCYVIDINTGWVQNNVSNKKRDRFINHLNSELYFNKNLLIKLLSMQKNIKLSVFFGFIDSTNTADTIIFWEMLDVYNFAQHNRAYYRGSIAQVCTGLKNRPIL